MTRGPTHTEPKSAGTEIVDLLSADCLVRHVAGARGERAEDPCEAVVTAGHRHPITLVAKQTRLAAC